MVSNERDNESEKRATRKREIKNPYRGGAKAGASKRSRLLRDMRWVYLNPPSEEETIGQRECRKMLVEDRAKFLSMLAGMEKDYKSQKQAASANQSSTSAGAGSSGSSGLMATDLSSERVEALIQELLAGWEKEKDK